MAHYLRCLFSHSSGPEFLRGEEWASHARDICTRRYEWPNLTILTCLLILGLHEFGTCQGGRSWALGGQAIRMAFALQLHKDLEYDPSGRNGTKTQLSFIDREIRRRIMWACFLMDRFNSSGTDRPMFIGEDTIQIPLPVKEKYFQFDMPAPTETLDGQVPHPSSPNGGQIADARENMGVAAFLIRAIALWGRIIKYLSQGGKDLDPNPLWEDESHYMKHLSDVVNLEASLPLSLKYSAENLEVHKTENTPSQFLFMHICLQHNILFVSRAAMSAQKQHGVHDDFFSEASKRTFNAANRISELLREAEQSRCFVSAPFAGYCAFSSATVHILGIISRNSSMKQTAEANLTTNVKYLHKMKKYWGMFHWMVENARTQYRNALDAMRAVANVQERATQSSFLQYGDWFNRYPCGLSDAEFMDPSTHKRKDSGADGVLEAKHELQSVEEYFTPPTPRSVENKDTIRAAAPKRKQSAKKQIGMPAQPGQHLDSLQSTDADAVSQERKFSGGLGLQTTGAAGFNPLAASNQQNPDFSTMSPTSPANMTPFAHHAHTPTFSPPELLAMNFGQGSNGNIDPLGHQFVYGAYSMDASTGPGDGRTWALLWMLNSLASRLILFILFNIYRGDLSHESMLPNMLPAIACSLFGTTLNSALPSIASIPSEKPSIWIFFRYARGSEPEFRPKERSDRSGKSSNKRLHYCIACWDTKKKSSSIIYTSAARDHLRLNHPPLWKRWLDMEDRQTSSKSELVSGQQFMNSFLLQKGGVSRELVLGEAHDRPQHLQALLALCARRRLPLNAIEWPELHNLLLSANSEISDLAQFSTRTFIRALILTYERYR
ncbi:hypothetical protein HZ326_26887 [Fusarium oxysporum f. sp. albedinis]|nr:hypothetical protein HZ326_26887 [Fusarium oxysporum f. sp. albedinis]